MANLMYHWIVGQESDVMNYSEDKCREILKTFDYDPMDIEVKGNQIKIVNKLNLIPKRVIRILADTFFGKRKRVSFYAEDDVQDYYKYYKILTR